MNNTIKIDNKMYDASSLTERASVLIGNIQRTDEMITRHQIEISIANIAKSKLLEELGKEVPNLVEIQAKTEKAQNVEEKVKTKK